MQMARRRLEATIQHQRLSRRHLPNRGTATETRQELCAGVPTLPRWVLDSVSGEDAARRSQAQLQTSGTSPDVLGRGQLPT